jgi:hypothetical protein
MSHHNQCRRHARRRAQQQFQNVFFFAELELFQKPPHEPAKLDLLAQFAKLEQNNSDRCRQDEADATDSRLFLTSCL